MSSSYFAKNKLVLLLLGFVIIGVGSVVFIYQTYHVLAYEKIPIEFSVVEGEVGLLLENTSLNFGHVPPGGGAKKRIELVSAVPARYVVSIRGDAANYVVPEPYEGLLEPLEPINVTFTVSVPASAQIRDYSGFAQIRMFNR